MNHRHLGRTGLRVSPLCLGTMNFGWVTSIPDSEAIMDRALEDGVNFFDTADVYSGLREGSHFGKAEEIIGEWWTKDATKRDRVVLATKVRAYAYATFVRVLIALRDRCS